MFRCNTYAQHEAAELYYAMTCCQGATYRHAMIMLHMAAEDALALQQARVFKHAVNAGDRVPQRLH